MSENEYLNEERTIKDDILEIESCIAMIEELEYVLTGFFDCIQEDNTETQI